jgi:hypothetical protein
MLKGSGMARVVVVHGIGQQYLGPRTMHAPVARAVVDGVTLAGGSLSEEDVEVAFYGDWFRPGGQKGEPFYQASDVDDPLERDLLMAMWSAAAAQEPDVVPGPDVLAQKGSTPVSVQRALDALSRSKFFAGLADRFLIGVLKQVRRYLTEDSTREFVQSRVAATVRPETSVLIGHSLGSVVAYEALCAHPEWAIRSFVTLGSPLGIRNIVFDRLKPSPTDGQGVSPGPQWTNIADRNDVVALVKELAPLFGKVVDEPVDNGWKAHALAAHLTAVQTGRAVAAGLA